MLFRFPLLHVDRPLRGEVLHAFFENVAFAIRGNCEQIAAVTGRPIPVLTVSGGGGASADLARRRPPLRRPAPPGRPGVERPTPRAAPPPPLAAPPHRRPRD